MGEEVSICESLTVPRKQGPWAEETNDVIRISPLQSSHSLNGFVCFDVAVIVFV